MLQESVSATLLLHGPSLVLPNTSTHAQGVHEYEPRVVAQLLDFVHAYTARVLQDADVRGLRGGNGMGTACTEEVTAWAPFAPAEGVNQTMRLPLPDMSQRFSSRPVQ